MQPQPLFRSWSLQSLHCQYQLKCPVGMFPPTICGWRGDTALATHFQARTQIWRSRYNQKVSKCNVHQRRAWFAFWRELRQPVTSMQLYHNRAPQCHFVRLRRYSKGLTLAATSPSTSPGCGATQRHAKGVYPRERAGQGY
jgi:hypothetical protein